MWAPHGRSFRENVSVWLYVNNTATAEFSVRFWNVQGAPPEWPKWSGYAVRHTSWDGTTSTRPVIDGLGGERRVRVANVAREPRGFWFWTVERGVEECGSQYLIDELLPPSMPVAIGFDVEVVNHSTAAKLFKRGNIHDTRSRSKADLHSHRHPVPFVERRQRSHSAAPAEPSSSLCRPRCSGLPVPRAGSRGGTRSLLAPAGEVSSSDA